MCSFGDKAVQKLSRYIPEDEKQSFKSMFVTCLKEGGASGLQKIKEEIKNLPQNPGEDVIKEIEDMYNDCTINTMSFIYHNKQAASIAAVLTKISDRIYLEEDISPELKAKVMHDTRQILNKLESSSAGHLSEEITNEILQHSDEMKAIANDSETCDLAETAKELATEETQ